MVFIYRIEVIDNKIDRSCESLFYKDLKDSRYKDLSRLFSRTSFIELYKGSLSETANYLRIKAYIAEEVRAISFLR